MKKNTPLFIGERQDLAPRYNEHIAGLERSLERGGKVVKQGTLVKPGTELRKLGDGQRGVPFNDSAREARQAQLNRLRGIVAGREPLGQDVAKETRRLRRLRGDNS